MTLVGAFTPTYDANGNVLNDGAHTYTWDADGNSITADGVGLTFDALERAVEQNRSGTYTQIVYGPGGGKLALMNAQSLVKAFVPLSGGATAVYTSAGLDHYRHSEWLGSDHLSSTPSRTVQWSGAYAPWGELYASSPSGSSDPSFTGQNSDTSSTGEYDFLYRQYGTQGRWPTPDPAGLAAVSVSNPQSWNRYAYDFPRCVAALCFLAFPCVFYVRIACCLGGFVLKLFSGYWGEPLNCHKNFGHTFRLEFSSLSLGRQEILGRGRCRPQFPSLSKSSVQLLREAQVAPKSRRQIKRGRFDQFHLETHLPREKGIRAAGAEFERRENTRMRQSSALV